jgi:integrase
MPEAGTEHEVEPMSEDLRFSFTKPALERLPMPGAGQRVTYHDTKTPGLTLRVTSAGAKSYCVQKRINGRVERITLGKFPGMTIEQARMAATKVLGTVAAGDNPAEVKRGKRQELTLGELFDEYMTRRAAFNKRADKPEALFRLYLSHWANRKISTIRHEEVDRLHKSLGREIGRKGTGKIAAANNMLRLLHVMFNQAINVWRIYQGDNPAHGIKQFEEKSRDRFLQADELPRFFAALAEEQNTTIRDYVLISLLTGARKSNVLEMEWSQVNFDRGEWRIPETKNGTPQTVTLAPEAVEILKERKRQAIDNNPYVFPGSPRKKLEANEVAAPQPLKEPKTGWKRILKRADIPEGDLRLHDLRRSLGSWQARTGASLSVIGKSLNHKNTSTTAIYARLDLDPVRQSVDTAVAAMFEAGGLKETSVVPFRARKA